MMRAGLQRSVNYSALRQLALLALLACSATYGRFVIGPLQEQIAHDLDLSDTRIALLQGFAVAIPMAVGAIPLGLLVDRYPRSHIFPLLCLINVGALVLAAFADSFEVLFAARLLTGVVLGGCLVGAYAAVGDLYPPNARGRATMVVGMGEISAAPLAFALGGAVLAYQTAGQHDASHWRDALLGLCVPLLPIPFLMLLLDRGGAQRDAERVSFRTAWPTLWRCRALVAPVLLARAMVWIADGAVLVWAAPALGRGFGLPVSRIGTIIASAFLISGVVGPALGGPLADFCQRRGGAQQTILLMAGLSLVSAVAALFAVAPTVGLAGIGMTVFLALGYTIGVAAMAVATIVIPREVRGLYFAITIAGSAAFAVGVGPLAVSSLSLALGGPQSIGRALSIVCCLMSLMSAAIFLIGRKYFPRAEHANGGATK